MSIESDIEPDIVEYLGAHYGVETNGITDESSLEDLGVDSLAAIASLEDHG
jgi:acyl carrier protein